MTGKLIFSNEKKEKKEGDRTAAQAGEFSISLHVGGQVVGIFSLLAKR